MQLLDYPSLKGCIMTDYVKLKNSGFIPQRQNGYFCLRVKITGGHVLSQNLVALSEIAQIYGNGEVHLTSRQNIEIPFIALANIENVRGMLTKAGLSPITLGPRLRTITACQGIAVCKNGLINTQQLAKYLFENLTERNIFPHKFRIGLTGCHNNCLKIEKNDLGLKGGIIPEHRHEHCINCGVCQKNCPTGAIISGSLNLTIDRSKCVNCGSCLNYCPNKCWAGQSGIIMFFGGRFDNQVQTGHNRFSIITEDKKLLIAVNCCLDFYQKFGYKGERFNQTVARLSWAKFDQFILEA